MSLNSYAAEQRLAIFAELQKGLPPSVGSYSLEALAEAKKKGAPTMGSTRYEPSQIHFEFIYPDPLSSATILTVTIPSPERIVHLPVPEWVVESIWQGEISGSFHFESDARALLERFSTEIEVGANEKWFGPQQAKRRE